MDIFCQQLGDICQSIDVYCPDLAYVQLVTRRRHLLVTQDRYIHRMHD